MGTKILSSVILFFLVLSLHSQNSVTVDQTAYWLSALKNNNSSYWDTLAGCSQCRDFILSGTVSDVFGTKESDRHSGGSDCDATFNLKLDPESAARLVDLQKKYEKKTRLMSELHVEVICANKNKTCDVCNGITAIPLSALPALHDHVTVTGRLIIDKGKDEDADKSHPEFEIHPAYSIVKK
jgi:hypothetical protein